MSKTILIESQYLPPVSFFKTIMNYEVVLFEQHEYYRKSSYRNRCYLPAANGELMLSVPLLHGKNQRTAMKDVKIFNHKNWQREQWKTFCYLYRSAPYFEYYELQLQHFFEREYDLLQDLNIDLIMCLCELIGLKITFGKTETYKAVYEEENLVDYRNHLLPGRKPDMDLPVYTQVFEDRNGFFENMSIVDLLFAEGTNTKMMLKG